MSKENFAKIIIMIIKIIISILNDLPVAPKQLSAALLRTVPAKAKTGCSLAPK